MKIRFILAFIFASLISLKSSAQIQNVIVETYYVSDSLDATDTTDARVLEPGSKTYRIYIDLYQGSKLKSIYGDAMHQLSIESTDTIFNNIDRPSAYFGYLINKVWFPGNPTLALDSWLTLGRAAKNYYGVVKTDDSDGSFMGGNFNYGGSSSVPGGILVNNDAQAGTPITAADGLMPDTTTLSQWIDGGFLDGTGVDTTVFGSVNSGTAFISNSAYLQQNDGVIGYNSENKILVAQVTTKGDLSFKLNVVVIDTSGADINYVSSGNDTTYTNQGQPTIVEKRSPFLSYPPACGCRDPKYLEYSKNYACDNPDSCRTLIVFGCMDPAACNYNADANFNISELCCYPGFCNDRDIVSVCPVLQNERSRALASTLYPNPVQDNLALQIPAGEKTEMKFSVYNAFGKEVIQKEIGPISSDPEMKTVDVSALPAGVYVLRLYLGAASETKKFIKIN